MLDATSLPRSGRAGTNALIGKRIVVTGGARGLGAAFAAAICEQGAELIIGDVRADLGKATAEVLVAQGYRASFLLLDLGDPASIESFAEEIARADRRLDGLVNNGAIATGIGGKAYDEIDIETWDRVMAVNVRGQWLMTKALAPLLQDAPAGKVVNLASDTALWGAPLLLHYVASKGAVIAMTRSLARELGPRGISVNAIAPSLTLVEATASVSRERHELCVRNRALARPQVPEDNVGAVVFLLSDAATFITGQVLPVNGGFVFN